MSEQEQSRRIKELEYMAHGLYGTIVGLTEDPSEAVTIIMLIHMMLWTQCRQPDIATKMMLEDYNLNFLRNWEANEASRKGEIN